MDRRYEYNDNYVWVFNERHNMVWYAIQIENTNGWIDYEENRHEDTGEMLRFINENWERINTDAKLSDILHEDSPSEIFENKMAKKNEHTTDLK